jgi:hypothetical protein
MVRRGRELNKCDATGARGNVAILKAMGQGDTVFFGNFYCALYDLEMPYVQAISHPGEATSKPARAHQFVPVKLLMGEHGLGTRFADLLACPIQHACRSLFGDTVFLSIQPG